MGVEQVIVYGGNKLKGTVKIEGAKNAVLPILAATLLVEEGVTKLENVPILSDVYMMIQVIKHLNVDIQFNEELNEVTVDASKFIGTETNNDHVSQMRASITVMGPVLARNGHAKLAMPGGCNIGKRPIDLHLKGFQALGAKIILNNGLIEAIADKLTANTIYLDFPSVGATQNIMMAAVKAKGTTVIENAAREPEVVDLANFLCKMGANVFGAGTEVIQIEGVKQLQAVDYTIVQDRIEAGTFMIAAAMTEGDVLVENAIFKHNYQLISKLTDMGAIVREENNGIRVIGPKYIQPADVTTMPYPGFPTDMQAQIAVMLLFAEGTSVVTETIFENRFQHFDEMRKINADVIIDGNTAIITGGKPLRGSHVVATDLRAAAALILAGLRAKGITRVSNLNYLDRGYYEFHKKLQKLGAKVVRLNDAEKYSQASNLV